MKKLIVILTAVSTLLLSGCGSIMNGSTQNLSVSATPNVATISLLSSAGALISQSKGSLFYNLKRSNGYFDGADYNIKIDAHGYETKTVSLTSSASGWYIAGNLMLGGLIGWLIVDPATGGMWVFNASNNQDVDNLNVILIEDASEEIMKSAIKIK